MNFTKMLWWWLVLAVGGASPALAQSDDLDQFALLGGDSLAVRFEPICASRLAAGDPIVCEVAEDKTSGSRVLIAAGTKVEVKVIESQGSGRPGKPGKMKLTVTSVEAADGAMVPLTFAKPIEREGKGRNIIAKFLTLFLIKGGDPCILGEEVFYPRFERSIAVYLPRN